MYLPNEIDNNTGYPFCFDQVVKDYYPPIPINCKAFQGLSGSSITDFTVAYWSFSETHKQWGAVIRDIKADRRYKTWPIP